MEYLIKSVYRFLSKNGDISGVMQEVLKFLKRALFMKQKDLKNEFADLKVKLENLAQNPFERRSFVYLDIISWLESKVDGKTVEAVSKKKFLGRALHDVRVAAITKH